MDELSTTQSVTLCGFMASGKSAIGRALAARLGFAFADTDRMLLEDTGMTLSDIFAAGGESYFRDIEHQTVQKAALLPRTVISTGGGVMTFERNARLLAAHTTVVYIRRSFDDCYDIISKRKNRPIAGQKSREELAAMYSARIPAYERHAHIVIDNSGTIEEAAEAILRVLQKA